MTIKETCRCGAEFSVEAEDAAEAVITVERWRSDHTKCRTETRSQVGYFLND